MITNTKIDDINGSYLPDNFGEECSVYVIAKEVNGTDGKTTFISPVKIGMAKNTAARLRGVQTNCPFRIGMPYEFDFLAREHAFEIERMFHETQRVHRLYGEWFDIHPLAAIHLLCIGIRSALDVFMNDPSNREGYLDYIGVLWAEKRFSLLPPLEYRGSNPVIET
jgi:hypothetical protein